MADSSPSYFKALHNRPSVTSLIKAIHRLIWITQDSPSCPADYIGTPVEMAHALSNLLFDSFGEEPHIAIKGNGGSSSGMPNTEHVEGDDTLSTISRQRAESMRRREVVGQIMQERLAQVQELQQEFLNAQKEYFDINSEIRENDIEIKRLQLQEGCVVGEETEQAVGIPVGAVTLPPNTIPDLSTYLSKSRAATTVRRGRALKDSISVSSDVSSTWEQAS